MEVHASKELPESQLPKTQRANGGGTIVGGRETKGQVQQPVHVPCDALHELDKGQERHRDIQAVLQGL